MRRCCRLWNLSRWLVGFRACLSRGIAVLFREVELTPGAGLSAAGRGCGSFASWLDLARCSGVVLPCGLAQPSGLAQAFGLARPSGLAQVSGFAPVPASAGLDSIQPWAGSISGLGLPARPRSARPVPPVPCTSPGRASWSLPSVTALDVVGPCQHGGPLGRFSMTLMAGSFVVGFPGTSLPRGRVFLPASLVSAT
jgi:hypothetical protein